MFEWYRNAEICIAYLADIQTSDDNYSFENSVWFRRGWTLQELIAPRTVDFLHEARQVNGNKGAARHKSDLLPPGLGLERRIANRTGNPEQVLHDYDTSLRMSDADKMKWMDGRETTREEDMSYALCGIVGVSPGANYGEKSTGARQRLEEALQHKYRAAAPDRATLAMRNPEVMAFIYAHGVDLEARDRANCTALCRFAQRGNIKAVQTLLDMGADLEGTSAYERTPLLDATEHNNLEVVELLLRRGANVHRQDRRQDTALLIASRPGYKNIAETLLTYGADIDARNVLRFFCPSRMLRPWDTDHGVYAPAKGHEVHFPQQ